MALDATIGGVNSNSYVDVAFADTYFLNHILDSTWFSQIASVRESALVHSTALLDSLVDWMGDAETTTQALDWPRVLQSGEYESIIPIDLKRAVCELSLHLLTEGSTVSDDTLRSIKAGSVTIKFNEDRPTVVLPHLISTMVSSIGTMKQGFGGQIDTPKLVRV